MARPNSTISVIVAKDVTIDPASVDAFNATDVTAAVNGLKVGYPVQLWATALEAGLEITNAHASAADTLKFRLHNFTGVAINPASQVFMVIQR